MTGCRFHCASGRRQGFTLVEVLLTLCLLVVIASLAWPMLDKPFANQRLRKAADQVRAEWGEARVEALNSGLVYVFRYEIEGGQYRVESRAAAETPADGMLGQSYGDTFDSQQTTTDSEVSKGKLPENVTFVGSETTFDTRATSFETETGPVFPSDASWSEPILFYPDGTTSNARLVLRNNRDRCIELTLRGLTGVVKVGEVYSDEAQLR
ncbi:MAG: prepilin-type N-terminal cleavage/methylation domain-containing protein [Pirellulales bacterium]|nr:prepilin-type N-terminal cleavage/methylation domain-containing protein [Pirellulales bacterium]